MKKRILSGLIMAPLLIFIWLGGYFLFAICFLIGVLGVREFYKAFESQGEEPEGTVEEQGAVFARNKQIRPSHLIGFISSVLLYVSYLFSIDGFFNIMLWIFLVLLTSFLYMFRIDRRGLPDLLVTVFGVFYVVFLIFHIVLLDASDRLIQSGYTNAEAMYSSAEELTGLQFSGFGSGVWLVILTAFGTDICAYFTGVFFGKHKLCPSISPKKTIEGSIGGIVGSVILCGLWGWFFANPFFLHCLIIGALGGALSQVGDLSASILKRKLGVKDYGKLIPGHGGILDRFDSVLFTAPLVYYYVYFYNLVFSWILTAQAYG
jgi:phosphatidate cytidylyltransferase